MQILSDPDITGSSRYVGLSGAMAALGGDVSAVKDNPAALGVFRRSELSLTVGVDVNHNKMLASSVYPSAKSASSVATGLPELAWIFNINNDNRQKGVISNTLCFSYQRIRSYKNEWSCAANSLGSSQSDIMANQSKGLKFDDYKSNYAFDDTNIGWLGKVGYDGYLIDPVDDEDNSWVSHEAGLVDSRFSMSESGSVDNYSFGWGMNISNKVYWGISASLLTLSYAKNTVYTETFESGDYYTLDSRFSASGFGVNFMAGAIYRPVSNVRLALALQTPSFMSIKYTSLGNLESKVPSDADGTLHYSSSPSYEESLSSKLPMRVIAGAAMTFGSQGLLSFEYDYQHASDTSVCDVHLLKLGGEYVLKNNCFLNLGYALQLTDNYADGQGRFYPSYNSARLDTDFRQFGSKNGLNGMKHYASTGVSYRSRYFVLGAAYQFSYRNTGLYAHAYQEKPYPVASMSHRIVMTLAWRYR